MNLESMIKDMRKKSIRISSKYTSLLGLAIKYIKKKTGNKLRASLIWVLESLQAALTEVLSSKTVESLKKEQEIHYQRFLKNKEVMSQKTYKKISKFRRDLKKLLVYKNFIENIIKEYESIILII